MSNAITDRAGWLQERRKSIGASESPALFGVLPWASPYSLWCEKVGLTEQSEDLESTRPWLKSGRVMEKVIIEMLAEETGREVYLAEPFDIHRRGVLHGTIDGTWTEFHATQGLVQIKNVSAFKKKSWSEGVPRHIWIQCQHEMYCAGSYLNTVAALINGFEFIWCDVERDDAFIENELIPKCQEFWTYVQSETPPPIDDHQATEDALKQAFPSAIEGKAITLGGEFIEMDIERQQVMRELSDLEKRKKQIDNELRAAMKDAEIGLLPDCKYTLKEVVRKPFTVEGTTYRKLSRIKGGY